MQASDVPAPEPDAPIVFGTLGVSKVIEGLEDHEAISKMMIDMAGRAVRRHLQKANEQIGAIKTRLNLPNAGGLLILMNEAEPMIDISAIGYTLKTAFQTVDGAYPHITSVWVIVESHRIAMTGEREGFPHLHVFKSLERQAELDFIGRMLGAWGHHAGSSMERLNHGGDWNAMRPIYDECRRPSPPSPDAGPPRPNPGRSAAPNSCLKTAARSSDWTAHPHEAQAAATAGLRRLTTVIERNPGHDLFETAVENWRQDAGAD